MQIYKNFTFSGYLTRWPLTLICDLCEHIKLPILYQLTKFGSNQTSTFQMRPLSHFQPTLQLDLRWPLTLICALTSSTNKGSHVASMTQLWLKSIKACGGLIEPNVNLFSQQQATTTTDNSSGQSDPHESFLLRRHKNQNKFEQAFSTRWQNIKFSLDTCPKFTTCLHQNKSYDFVKYYLATILMTNCCHPW